MVERPPHIDNAPGLAWRKRKSGWEAQWTPPPDAVQGPYLFRHGFPWRGRPIWVGAAVTAPVALFIAGRCQELQADLEAWVAAQPTVRPLEYDGTLHTLIDNYLYDRASGFHKKRQATRANYKSLCKRLIEDRGTFVIAGLKHRVFVEWDDEWQHSGATMADALRRVVRLLVGFGTRVLEQEDCTRAATILHQSKIENTTKKEEKPFLLFEQAEAIVLQAGAMGFDSVALAQALQWASSMRQKDIIGERQSRAERGISDVFFGNEKWNYGARWEEIKDDLVWKHQQSKRGKMISAPLIEEPLFVAELNRQFPGCVTEELDVEASRREGREMTKLVPHREMLPRSGPIIINEATGAPYSQSSFRRRWRTVADATGIVPKEVKNMMTRAGTATEATNGGISLEVAAKALGHEDTKQTGEYSRDQAEKHKLFKRGCVADREARRAAKRENVA